MCRAGCLCVVIYSAFNNLTCFFPFLPRQDGGASPVVAQVYYPYYLPPAVAHFPHGGLNDEQTLQTNAAAYFFFLPTAPLKITGNRRNYFHVDISRLSRRTFTCEPR